MEKPIVQPIENEEVVRNEIEDFQDNDTIRMALNADNQEVVRKKSNTKVKSNTDFDFLDNRKSQRLLELLQRNQKHYTAFLIMMDCGLRIGETINLQVRNFDFKRKVLNVKSLKKRGDELIRQIPLSDRLFAQLANYLPKINAKLPDDYLFPNNNGGHITRKAFNQVCDRIKQKHPEFSNLHPHTLRHTFATQLLANGAELHNVKTLLGHTSFNTTLIYNHTPLEILRQNINAVSEKKQSRLVKWLKSILGIEKPKPVIFTSSDNGNFIIGRDQEIKKIAGCIDKNINTVLTGRIGIGKNHIINQLDFGDKKVLKIDEMGNLPDIDHTKSPIGKAFYPLAKWIDRKFGHRTITHSLVFYILFGLFVGLVEMELSNFQIIKSSNHQIITSIYFWAFGSHLVFDMMTKSGVPLLYPFKKNPCVIPGNQNFRLRSGNFRTESIVFCVFLIFGFACKSLFANGFWNSYNKVFSNAKHIAAEMKISANPILVKYEIRRLGETIKGEGYAISETGNNILLLSRDALHASAGFFTIKSDDKIISANPIRTNKKAIKETFHFSNISFDSLQNLIRNKNLLSIKLQSSLPISFEKDNKPQSGVSVELENVRNPVFRSSEIDSTDESVLKDIQLLKLDIARNQSEIAQFANEKAKAYQVLQKLENDRNSPDLALQEYAIRNYQSAKNHYESFHSPTNNLAAYQTRLDFLHSRLKIHKNQSVSGYLETIKIL